MRNSPEYKIQFSASSPSLFPTEMHLGMVEFPDGSFLDIPKRFPIKGEWGEILSYQILLRDQYPMPIHLLLVWLSIIENKFYQLSLDFPSKIMGHFWSHMRTIDGNNLFSHIVVGMAPYGDVAIWFGGVQKSCVIAWAKGCTCNVEMNDFLPDNSNISINDYCNYYLKKDIEINSNLQKKGLPPCYLFDKYMQQFTYRYLALFEHWNKDNWVKHSDEENEPEFDYIEEALFDGTHDKLHDGGLMNYHQAGKPKKLAVKWHIKKSEYTAYFWFEDEEIRTVFDRFYGAHPETKTDFMIRIDSENNKYELALYRYGLKKPQVISESAYQLLVFKNKFEYYRSENYNQAKGAWVW